MASKIAHSLLAQPCPENFYLVDFEDIEGLETNNSCGKACIQMLRPQIAKPFIPSDRTDLIALFEKSNPCYHAFFGSDPSKSILSTLPLRELLNFSETCKLSYLVVRSNAIWKIKLKKLLPSITPLKDCHLNPEQQFQVIFRKISAEKKPFMQLLESYKKCLFNLHQHIESKKPDSITKEAELITLVGKDYSRDCTSIAPNSKMGRCFLACKLIPKQFDKQEVFEGVIKTAEKAYKFEIPNF